MTTARSQPVPRRALRAFDRHEVVGNWPTDLAPGVLYVRAWHGLLKGAHLLCPCGCGESLFLLALTAESEGAESSRWLITLEEDDTVTIRPSILRKTGCRTHFTIRHNKISYVAPAPPAGTS